MKSRPVDERSIFLQAIDLASAEERAAFLDEVCGPNASLRREIDALLEAHGRPLGLLDLPDRGTPTAETPYGAVVVFRDPDGIQIEFFVTDNGS